MFLNVVIGKPLVDPKTLLALDDLDWKNNELDDAAIIKALKQAVKDYEDGAIAEVHDSLTEIVVAIDEFEANMEGN